MDSNLEKYNDPSVVAVYAAMGDLQECEKVLFESRLAKKKVNGNELQDRAPSH